MPPRPVVLAAMFCGCWLLSRSLADDAAPDPQTAPGGKGTPAQEAVADARPDSPSPVVFVGRSTSPALEADGRTTSPTLVRELMRQALLIAAREELRLSTRDAWLGSEMPAGGDNSEFNISFTRGKEQRLSVWRGAKAEVVHELPVGARLEQPNVDFPALIVELEAASRTSLVDVLKKAGFQRQPPPAPAANEKPATDGDPAGQAAAIAGDIEGELADLNLFSHFKALRSLHAALQNQGESPAVMAALVRRYADLGVLTEMCWHPAHKVFKARALLYAQRMVAKEPQSRGALEQLAYAEALCGLHAVALATLDRAGRLPAAAAAPGAAENQAAERAVWLPAIEAYCRVDTVALEQLQADATLGRLPQLLRFFALEQAGCSTLTVEHGIGMAQVAPLCFRVQDGLCRLGGVGLGHSITAYSPQMLAQTLRENLTAMPELPPAVARLLKAGGSTSFFGRMLGGDEPPGTVSWKLEAKIMRALLDLGRAPAAAAKSPDPEKATESAKPGDPAKPSDSAKPADPTTTAVRSPAVSGHDGDANELRWETLGLLLRELSWTHIWRRANFEVYMLGTSADEWLAGTRPVWSLHPYQAFMAAHAWDIPARIKARQELLAVDAAGIEVQAARLASELAQTNDPRWRPVNDWIWKNTDETAFELLLCVTTNANPGTRNALAQTWLTVSPHAPLAQALLVESSFEKNRQAAADWETRAEHYPTLALAFARRYLSAGELGKAEALLRPAAKKSHELAAYWALAEVYEKQGQEARWLATLEEYLKQPAFGLEHAQVNASISQHFARKDQWAEAKPYADAAAESWAAFGLLEAARVNEALRDWPAAEKYYAAVSQRYRGSNFEWYFFCKRTGEGDVEQAARLARQHADELVQQKQTDSDNLVRSFYLLDKQFDKALDGFEQAGKKKENLYNLMHAALVAEELKQPERRDANLKLLTAVGKKLQAKKKPFRHAELIPLAEAFLTDLDQNGPAALDIPALEAMCTTDNPFDACSFHYFLGCYLDHHGQPALAIEQWKKCMAYQQVLPLARTHAGDQLIRHEVFPGEYDLKLPTRDKAAGQDAKTPAK